MDNLFLLLSLVSIIALIIGLIKPELVVRWGNQEKKNRKSVLKVYGLAIIVFFILFSITTPSSSNEEVAETETELEENIDNDEEVEEDKLESEEVEAEQIEEPPKNAGEASEEKTENDVPREYKNALRAAQNYVDIMPFSEKGLFEQLTSEHGDQYPEEVARYAIENVEVDYNEEALEAAKNYQKVMPMSDKELFDQLTSEHGEQFTEEQAQYAIDNLPE